MVKLFHSQLNRTKSGLKNGTQVTLNFSLNVVDDSIDQTNFPHKLLLTNTQVSRLRKAFANSLSANIKLSKTQLHKMEQSGGFLGRLLEPLLKNDLPLMKNVFKPLAKSVLVPLGLTTPASAIDESIQKKSFRSGMTTLIFSNKEMISFMKIIKSVEGSDLLIKLASETIKNEAKEQKCDFSFDTSLLGNLLTGKGVKTKIPGKRVMRIGEGTIRADEFTIRVSQNF